ncbi:adenosylcobinamide-GDP ribazoletransferase [Salipiger marinus]|uniref:adenosylcobinamide-GDP ribazoletransferase n=1 Tax=Salipiger marinus TaxID=555512 RepID=UPI002B746A6C|nr:adenosylcobinamide-GDP ribazoletransferase [Salipiger manganoxidans]MEB3418895.1 adenosylcobinamide-GDP ribazoletransferase [Salipiger manganoxidans]
MRQVLAQAQVALMLLTRLPAGGLETAPPMARSVWAWPLVGALVGGIAALVYGAASLVLPPMACALLAMAAAVLATGGLHEDGLADCADGFGGGTTRARKLEILRDSRIGSYGVLALGLVLALRATALAHLPPAQAMTALVAMGAASRALLPLWLRLLPPARADGLGRAAMGPTRGGVLVAGLLGLAALLLLGPVAALVTGAAMLAASAAFAGLALRQIGGQTGDVLGAQQQVADLAGLLALLALAG